MTMTWNPTSWGALPASVRQHLSGRRRLSALQDYFRYHGIYAPLVRFMRDVDFRYKSLLVAGAFTLPVSVVLSMQFQSQWHLSQQMDQQVAGWRYMVLLDQLQGAMRLTQATPAGSAAPTTAQNNAAHKVEQAYLDLSQWHDQLGLGDPTQEAWQGLAKAYLAWQESSGTGGSLHAQQARDLQLQIGNLSSAMATEAGLGLTQDRPSLAMTQLALETWPAVQDHLNNAELHLPAADATDVGEANGQLAAQAMNLANTMRHLQGAMRVVQDDTLLPCLPHENGQTPWRTLPQLLQQAINTPHNGADWGAMHQRLDTARQEASDIRRQCLLAMSQAATTHASAQSSQLGWLAGIMGFGLLLALYTMVAFSRVMRGGMQLIQKEVERMAQGDLSGRTLPLGDDEVAATLRSLRQSLLRLADLFTVVRRGVASVSHASGDISSASEDLAGNVLQATDAIDEMNRGVAITLEYLESNQGCVNQAVDCARDMSADAGRGRRAMNRLAEVIEGLQLSSREIEKFVSLIDGIAFQTNLLALNASVEAAKAGASGKGFAVVAAEVRGLANRVAEAAGQISTVVSDSTNQIAQGQEIARTTVDAVRSTETHVNEMNRILKRLAHITEEGRGNADQMTATLKDVQHNSHQTKDLVVQVEQAAKELRQQSLKLAEQSSRFKLG